MYLLIYKKKRKKTVIYRKQMQLDIVKSREISRGRGDGLVDKCAWQTSTTS